MSIRKSGIGMGWLDLSRQLKRRGLSQNQFAVLLGVTRQKISCYFKPGFDPNFSTVLIWAKVLDCSVSDLVNPEVSADERRMPRTRTSDFLDGTQRCHHCGGLVTRDTALEGQPDRYISHRGCHAAACNPGGESWTQATVGAVRTIDRPDALC